MIYKMYAFNWSSGLTLETKVLFFQNSFYLTFRVLKFVRNI